ncbi:MAG: F0F1 ATP synthase subunit gamma [Anaerolineae bacterium]|nr:F0F1 ATP synthase subunit gamma [Anaerolineae bacterium]
MADLEQIRGRLDNISTVQPVLGALRTISLGSWQAALNRRGGLQRYATRLESLLPLFMTAMELGSSGRRLFVRADSTSDAPPDPCPSVLLAVGSERGLCGRFNQVVAEQVDVYLEQHKGIELRLMVLGSRLSRILKRRGITVAWESALPTSALPSFLLARDLVREWLGRYEAYTLDGVAMLFNAYRGVGRYETVTRQILPFDMGSAAESAESEGVPVEFSVSFIIETDPWSLYTRVLEQQLMIRCYSYLLESATSEHATRYQLMEGAAQNAERLLEELTSEMQALRRQAITREMQELAVGAGLLQR